MAGNAQPSPDTRLRVPFFVPIFNPIARRLLGAGVPLGPNALLTVRGRRTGAPRTTPVFDRFGRWAMQAGSTVETVPDPAGARAAIARLAQRLSASRVTATREAAGFAPPGALVGGSAVQVADADLGISVAILAVAE